MALTLNIFDYISTFNSYEQLRTYVSDHIDTYRTYRKGHELHLPVTDDTLSRFLRRGNKSVLGRDSESFRKFVENLRKSPTASVSRKNLLRLLFVLGFRSANEANHFLQNYMHVSELSARNLEEFIVLAALKTGLSWIDVYELLDRYTELLRIEPNAPDTLDPYAYETYQLFHTIINDIHTKKELLDFLDKKENQVYFARTRNTVFLALFDDIQIDSNLKFIDDEVVTKNAYPVKRYFLNLFGMVSTDDDLTDADFSGSYLSEKEISVLAKHFTDVFMTYETFTDIVHRNRSEDIPYGPYLLHLLLTTSGVEEDGIDFSDYDEVVENLLNDSLFEAGFPKLSRANSFDRLVLDAYLEVLNSSTTCDSSEHIRTQFLFHLRAYLKQISAILEQNT